MINIFHNNSSAYAQKTGKTQKCSQLYFYFNTNVTIGIAMAAYLEPGRGAAKLGVDPWYEEGIGDMHQGTQPP